MNAATEVLDAIALPPGLELLIAQEEAEREQDHGQQDRIGFLGGSDAAAVMGLSPWATPVELFLQKRGLAPKQRVTPAKRKLFKSGHRWEPVIRDMVIDRLVEMGLHVELVAANRHHTDPEHEWMRCEVDFELRITGDMEIGGRMVRFDREHINADAKTVHTFAHKKWGEENTEDVPIEYAVQFLYGLMLTGRRACLVAALKSVHEVDIYWTLRDDETIAAMRPKLVDFWVNHVLTGVAPDPLKFSDIKLLFPLDNGEAIEATEPILAKVARLAETKQQIAALRDIEELLTFDIAEFISPNSRLTHKGRELMTWKGQPHTALDEKALQEEEPEIYQRYLRTSTVRVLRFTKPKKGSFR